MFLDPVGIFFLDLHVFVLDPGKFVSTAKLIVSELGFLFFGPVHLLPGPCLHRVGGNSIVIGAHIGLDVFGPWRLLIF